MKAKSDSLQIAIQRIQAANASEIGSNDYLFLQRIYRDGLQKYLDRLMSIGFLGKQRVLDAGCGYGQWSLALSGLNTMVESCDISSLRVRFLQELSLDLGISNLSVQVSGIDVMPYADETFDAVFCYGVIFLTAWRKSLAELTRVLKPGGRLYVNANGLGWYMFLWQEEHNKTDDYDPKLIAANSLLDSLNYERLGLYEAGINLIIEPQAIEKELEMLGCSTIQIGPEGGVHLNQSGPFPVPFFKGEYYGQVGVYELVATKNKA